MAIIEETKHLFAHKGGQLGNTNALKWTEEKALELGNELIEWLTEDEVFIQTLNGEQLSKRNFKLFFNEFLLVEKNLYEDIISNLYKNYPSFKELIKKAKKIQEFKLNKLSLLNLINPTMAIFCLKNHHGYRDRKDDEGKTINIQQNIVQIQQLLGKSELE